MINTNVTARISPNLPKIIISGYAENLIEFFRSLPDARFDKTTRTWSCSITPATCYRLSRVVECSTTIREVGDAFSNSIKPAVIVEQPKNRKYDSWQHQCEAYTFAMRKLGIKQ